MNNSLIHSSTIIIILICVLLTPGIAYTTSTTKITTEIIDEFAGTNINPEKDCVAGKPEGPLIDTSTGQFSQVSIQQGKLSITEKARFKSTGDWIEISQGGCAHTGVGFSFLINPHKDKKRTMHTVITFLKELHLNEEGKDWLKYIEATIKKNQNNKKSWQEMVFPDTEGYSYVYFMMSDKPEKDGRFRVEIYYSIAL